MANGKLRYYVIAALLFTAQLFFCGNVFAQGNFKLAGTIDRKYDGGYVKLGGYGIKYGSIKSDIKNGEFYFSDKIEKEYEQVWLEVWKNGRIAGIGFYIIPGKMRINIRNIDGNPEKNDIDFINIPFVDIQNEYENLVKTTDSIYSNSDHFFDSVRKANDGNIADALWSSFLRVSQRKLDTKIGFIKNHIDSYYALYTFFSSVLNNFYIDSDSLSAIFFLFSNKLQHTIIGKQTDSIVKRKSVAHLSKQFFDISFKTDSGNLYSISDYRGQKYVLICFWASWCGPCKKNIPFLRKVAQSYESKGLQLISISIDVEEERWKFALNKNPMPWLQTCDLPKYMADQKIREKFAVNVIPQYFLLDKSGKIIYNNFQSKDNDNYAELQHILEMQLN